MNQSLSSTRSLPLRDRCIIITRAREQAAEFAVQLEALGALVITLPLIQIADPPSWALVDRAMDQLAKFDLLIFTSVNAVDKWTARGLSQNKSPVLKTHQVYAVGAATAHRLQELGLQVDAVPKNFSAEGILETLGPDLIRKRVLLPRGDLAREELPRELRARGAEVLEVVVYRTQPAETKSSTWIERIRGGEIDVITFASPSAVQQFVLWVGREQLAIIKNHFRAASIGPTTSAALREQGVDVAIEATPSTLSDLTAAIIRFYQSS
ncbi:MAG: uroporphyrinogen-III synthase [Acidobacteriia bacterium]|nr:uroporphyrinogen-III synthase [Terriglobia bacterium]